MEAVLVAQDVTKRFAQAGTRDAHTAVQSVSFKVDAGEVVCIVGKSGCGKSTLVNILLGLLKPTAGEISIGGFSPSGDFMKMRRQVAAVFQGDRLLPWRTIVDNVAIGLEAIGVKKAERREAAMTWLRRVGLQKWHDSYPHELSGGMRQRVAICRAFVLDPRLILLDEAFGHLDEVTAQELRQDCLGLISESHKAALVVTHNISEALDIGDRILVLGRPASVLQELTVRDLRSQAAWSATSEKLRNEIFATIDRGHAAPQ
jgi:NitT/TauT family transport system ATP-binding protein